MSDINYPMGDFAYQNGIMVSGLLLEPPVAGAGLADIFKNSACVDCVFQDVTVKAGAQSENAWDANNGTRGNTYRRLKLDAGREPAVYLKDGFCGNVIDDVEITRSGGHSDWYEGDYSDQGGTKNTHNTRNNVRRSDGKPVRVAWAFFRAEKPIFTNSNVRYQYFWSIVRTAYVEWMYLFA